MRCFSLLDIVAEWQILVIIIITWGDGNPVNGAGVIVVEETGRNRRCKNCFGYAEGLASVQIITGIVDVWIVLREDGRVEPILGPNGCARVVILDDMNLGAIFSGGAKAELSTNLKVATHCINYVAIDCGQLVG